MLLRIAIGSLVVLLGSAATAAQTPQALGPQFQVNSHTIGNQGGSHVVSDARGNFAVAWTSDTSPGTDNSEMSIQGRYFGRDGVAQGLDFQINTYTTFRQFDSEIALRPDGAVGGAVWQSEASDGTDTSADCIRGRAFFADGTPTEDFQVNTSTYGWQEWPSVSVDANGIFVVVWGDLSTYSVRGQRFDEEGWLGSEFQVNTATTYDPILPEVDSAPGGDFVVVWRRLGAGGNPDYSDVAGQRFASDGSPAGEVFQVETHSTLVLGSTEVATAANGDFVVTWSWGQWYPPYSHSYDVFARRFASDGSPLGGRFMVNTTTSGYQELPRLAVDRMGDFVVVWASDTSSGTDPDAPSIQGQRFSSAGIPLGDEFQVNTLTTGRQTGPAIAEGREGRFIVSWTSEGSPGTDSDGRSIQAQILFVGVFADGFEVGDASAWSSTVP